VSPGNPVHLDTVKQVQKYIYIIIVIEVNNMTIVNYIIDNNIVNKLTTNRKWLDSYIPVVAECVEQKGFDIVFDKRSDFDIMHIHIPMALAYRLSTRNNHGNHKPVIFHGHITEDTFMIGSTMKYFIRKWMKKIARESDMILCPSHSAVEYYQEHLPEKDIRQLNYGIDLDRYAYFHDDGMTFRQRYRIKKDEIVVCCVGGMIQRKGIDDFCKVARRFPAIHFIWVGGTFYKNQHIHNLYNLIVRDDNINMKDIPENVICTGYTPDVTAALSASDIFFFPSRHETQGLALVEAAANNRPIITRDLPVFKEWLTHGSDCLMGTNVDEFTTHIKTLVEDRDLAIKLGEKAGRSAQKHHDIRMTSRSLAEIYEELIGKN
jgi:1,2-diacylglycerol-3-alpha-glucose alpha-1,2-glucosyltransferase